MFFCNKLPHNSFTWFQSRDNFSILSVKVTLIIPWSDLRMLVLDRYQRSDHQFSIQFMLHTIKIVTAQFLINSNTYHANYIHSKVIKQHLTGDHWLQWEIALTLVSQVRKNTTRDVQKTSDKKSWNDYLLLDCEISSFGYIIYFIRSIFIHNKPVKIHWFSSLFGSSIHMNELQFLNPKVNTRLDSIF